MLCNACYNEEVAARAGIDFRHPELGQWMQRHPTPLCPEDHELRLTGLRPMAVPTPCWSEDDSYRGGR